MFPRQDNNIILATVTKHTHANDNGDTKQDETLRDFINKIKIFVLRDPYKVSSRRSSEPIAIVRTVNGFENLVPFLVYLAMASSAARRW